MPDEYPNELKHDLATSAMDGIHVFVREKFPQMLEDDIILTRHCDWENEREIMHVIIESIALGIKLTVEIVGIDECADSIAQAMVKQCMDDFVNGN